MIQKDRFHLNTLAEFLAMKASADIDNTTYTTGSLDAVPVSGEPDIPFASVVFIAETRQIWTHGTFYGNDSSKMWMVHFNINWSTGELICTESVNSPFSFRTNDEGELLVVKKVKATT